MDIPGLEVGPRGRNFAKSQKSQKLPSASIDSFEALQNCPWHRTDFTSIYYMYIPAYIQSYVLVYIREGFRKKNPYFLWSFAKPGGGGSARVVKKPYCFFEKVFFQRACRIILVPPKHVLHLVWSPYVIYTAIESSL